MQDIEYDRAIAELVHRWFRPPAGLTPRQFTQGMRRLLFLQALAAGVFYLLM